MIGKAVLKRAAGLLLAAALLPISALPVRAEEGEISRRLSDYTGEGTLIAVIDMGFDTAHEVFSVLPTAGKLTKREVADTLGDEYAAAYVSEKIPLALDYAGGAFTPDAEEDEIDTGVLNLSDGGTALAALAAGNYAGKGDIETENGVLHDADYRGAAPGAQLLLMKAAQDGSQKLRADAVTAALTDALALGADVVVLDLSRTEMTDAVADAIRAADAAGVPVVSATGDLTDAMQRMLYRLPAAVVDRGTLPDGATLPGVITVGSVANPTGNIVSFLLGEREIFYIDTSAEYIGKSFADVFSGETLPVVAVPGVGAAEDYASLLLNGCIVLVTRGEISFTEKAKNAAAAGAVGMIVVDTGEGLSRMALTDSPIPAVMISAEDGALFAGESGVTVTLAPAVSAVADFSAFGASEDFSATVSLLAEGDNVRVPAGGAYEYGSSTAYAAARVAGYYAATLQYARAAGMSDALSTSLLFGAASPMTDESGTPLSPRAVGAGVLTADAVIPAAVIRGEGGRAVSMLGAWANSSVWLTFDLVNTAPVARKYTVSAAFTTDEVDGQGILTGKSIPLPGVYMSVTTDGQNVTDGATLSVGANSRVTVNVRMTLGAEAKAQLSAAPHGAFADAIITCEADGEAVQHGISFFREAKTAPSLADATPYGGEEPLLAQSLLAVYSVSGGYSRPLGALLPGVSSSAYDMSYNIVNPAHLHDGWLEFRLTALRRIGEATVRFYDSDGRLVYTRALGEVKRYIATGGRTALPLWNFRAEDEPLYVFPDGTYRCEITLVSVVSNETETLSFTVRADSEAPTVSDVRFTDDGAGDLRVALAVSDAVALASVKVYDLSRDYGTTGDTLLGKTEAEVSFDLSLYDGASPLYIEVTDLAGGITTVRYTLTEIAETLLSASAA